MPLYKRLKKSDHFTWIDKAQEAFDRLKAFLLTPPTLVSPEKGELLLLYIAATTQVVSAALIVERDKPGRSHKMQRWVDFIS
jgi:dsDNA-binding SOS-regulon protein